MQRVDEKIDFLNESNLIQHNVAIKEYYALNRLGET
jgi:hypothetical protein